METLKTSPLAALPAVRVLGRHTPDHPETLFWTAGGLEMLYTGSELWVEWEADYSTMEPWVSVELNGGWISRFALPKGRSRSCLFRGMTPGKAKRVRILKDSQAMFDDPAHLLRATALCHAPDGAFLPLPEPKLRLEFVGDSITSGEGAIGAVGEEDWVGAFFSAENNYARMTADALGAEYRCICQSGWGVLCGWDNDPRHALPGYYTRVCGVAQGGRKTLKKFLSDKKIPARAGHDLPLIARGNEVYAVVGVEIADSVKITKETAHRVWLCVQREETNDASRL